MSDWCSINLKSDIYSLLSIRFRLFFWIKHSSKLRYMIPLFVLSSFVYTSIPSCVPCPGCCNIYSLPSISLQCKQCQSERRFSSSSEYMYLIWTTEQSSLSFKLFLHHPGPDGRLYLQLPIHHPIDPLWWFYKMAKVKWWSVENQIGNMNIRYRHEKKNERIEKDIWAEKNVNSGLNFLSAQINCIEVTIFSPSGNIQPPISLPEYYPSHLSLRWRWWFG